jgi:hypothetical protein
VKKITIRLHDDDLHARIVQAAAREKRSLNGQIEWLLQAGMDASKPLIDLHYEYKTANSQNRPTEGR